eukprot:CAMPEP_0115348636 /NCGR_PEP_ID=MMETSP0270-20121206/95506_1 /TAXON_ID=71861 /ORGANISM="Scrippsiella trochoidea, Strain CCMP3099" /LENGTH=135 /DNA_ID=CAMNT_0002770611 /DNA_START=109 /DNA_END=513 /DNA_ORIENTATION=-
MIALLEDLPPEVPPERLPLPELLLDPTRDPWRESGREPWVLSRKLPRDDSVALGEPRLSDGVRLGVRRSQASLLTAVLWKCSGNNSCTLIFSADPSNLRFSRSYSESSSSLSCSLVMGQSMKPSSKSSWISSKSW